MLRGATAATAAVALALVASGCGDDEPEQEPVASYAVGAPVASFPARQHLAHPVELKISVENTGRRTIPNVSATIRTRSGDIDSDAFSSTSEEAGLASRSRPVWIVDEGPENGDTAFGNTWALGSVKPGRTRTFTWRVVPVRAGRYELRYRLFGSANGRARLRLADGSAPRGAIPVRISGKPAQVRVTADGRIVSEPPS